MKNLILLIACITFLQSSYSFEIDFMEPLSCEANYRHHSFCFATKPNSWNEVDKDQILKSINEWPAEVKQVLPTKIKLYRMGFGYTPISAFSNKSKKDVYAWAEGKNKVYVTDLFFNSKKIIEGSHYTFNSYTLLHEMIHLFDHQNKRLSKKEDFLNLYGWIEIDDPNSYNRYISKKWVMKDVDYNLIEEQYTHIRSLMETGHKDEAARKSLLYAAKHGLPTMYSTSSPQECFAELITNYLLAPDLNSQLKPEALEWLRDLVRLD